MKRLLTTIFLCVSLACAHAQTGLFFSGEKLSSTLISCICQDRAGYIWIGTDYGLNRFDGYRFSSYLSDQTDSTMLRCNTVVCLLCDRDGRLWVGTSCGLQRYDYATDHFVNYTFPGGNQPRVNDIVQTRDGRLLVGTAGYGIYQLMEETAELSEQRDFKIDEADTYFSHIYEDPAGGFWRSGSTSFTYQKPGERPRQFASAYGVPTDFFDLGGKTVIVCRDNFLIYEDGQVRDNPFDISEARGKTGFRTAMKDRLGNIYVGTRGNGLYWIPAGTRRLMRYPVSANNFDLNASKVWALAEDTQGNVWVGCQQKGLLLIPNRKAQFASWSFSGQKIDIGTFVSSICEGDNGMTWCTVQDKGVYGFDAAGRIVSNPASPHDVEFIYRDRQHQFWLGTSHGAFAYDPLTGATRQVISFDCDKFNDMTDDGRGHLFFSAFSKGILRYDRDTQRLRHFSMKQTADSARGVLCNDWVMAMMSDHDGRIWLGTSAGVGCYDPAADSFRPFGWSVLSAGRLCSSLCETHEGDVLIGTEQGLYVWRRKTNQFEDFPKAQPLKNLVISYIVQDNEGDIWCSTSVGIWHYRAQTQEWVSYVHGSGLQAHEYINNVGRHLDDDRIFFATSDGVTTFTPQQVNDVQVAVGQICLTGFYISGHPVSTLTRSDGHVVTDRPVTESDHFTVSYLESQLSLEFSLLNYSNASNTIFEYRLNSSAEWTPGTGGNNVVVLSHLPSGTYRLEVRAIDNGVESSPRLYTIVVLAPWYRSTTAYVVYVLLLLSLVSLMLWAYRRHMRQQLDEDRMKFLINATHDIRSPLTLIMSPLAKLRRRQLDDESQTDLAVIDRNARRILNLVNQILDVRKIDKQQMHLHCRQTDMRQFIDVIYRVYEYNASERNINFVFSHPDQPVTAWIDRTQFDKVVSNLLSNAFKYSFDHGDIEISLSQGHDDGRKEALKDYVEISVTDNGTGMRDDTIQHIFDRFYQGKTDKSSHIEGTGIGLNLCKMIVDMHHGTITAQNRTDGQRGSVFTVRLPQGYEHLDETEIDDQHEQPTTIKMQGRKRPRSNYHVLVVDDDEEIGRYIGQELGDYYHFAVCANGKDGLKELLTNSYDVVVSDVMMPEMDGFTMLRMIKTNMQLNHLPVIMLTSKSDIANRLEGLEKGADAYLTKPFSMDELHVTIDNLIANHLRLKGKFSGAQQAVDRVEKIEVKGNDEQLMERIMKSINQHLGDSDYSVDTMCDEVGISRAHLHRKMKELTGIPVSEFVRNIRLEQGARLLKEQKLNITQVAYTVGFSNLGYFSTVFRKHFGVSPREFVEQHS